MRKNYKSYKIYESSEKFLKENELIELKIDSKNWRIYYTDKKENWIRFNPFSEYHGGGQSYLINIEQNDFESWILDHPNFHKEIRKIIENE